MPFERETPDISMAPKGFIDISEIIFRQIQSSEDQPINQTEIWSDLPRKQQERFREIYEKIEERQKKLSLQMDSLDKKRYNKKQKIIDRQRHNLYESVKEYRNSSFDQQTGLVLLGYLQEEISTQMLDYLQQKNGSELGNTSFLFVDLKKLKESNVLIGVKETDDKIRKLAKKNIFISQFLSNKQNQSVYCPINERVIVIDQLDTQLLTPFNQKKIMVTPARKQAGGDEFLFKIDFNNYSPQQEQETINLVKQVFNSISISPLRDLTEPNQRLVDESKIIKENRFINREILPSNQYSRWCDAINSLKYVSSNDRLRDSSKKYDLAITTQAIGPERIEATNFFFDKLRNFFIDHQKNKTNQYQEIFLVENQLTFDFAHLYFEDESLPNLSDAFLIFTCGVDSFGNKYYSPNSSEPIGIFDLESNSVNQIFLQKILPEIKKEYLDYLYINPNSDKEKVLNEIICNQIVENFFTIMFDNLEAIGKKDKIYNDLEAACLGDPRKILSLGMSSFVDRGIHKFSPDYESPFTKFSLAKKIFVEYQKRYQEEIKKPNYLRDKYLISFIESMYENCLKYKNESGSSETILKSPAEILV